MDFVREMMLPRYQYLIATLNPDNPDKEIYNEIVNRCRPIKSQIIPSYIQDELNKSEAHPDWNYWFFSYDDNPIVTEEKRKELLSSLLPDTVEYQTKILGKRAKGVGLIFRLQKKNIISREEAKKYKFKLFSCGVDTAYSSNSDDTFSFMFGGLTACGKWVVLEELVLNNKGRQVHELISPSDIPKLLIDFLDRCKDRWGLAKDVFVDSADQATMSELLKYKFRTNCIYNFINAYKKTKILDRVLLENGWLANGNYLILEGCVEHIKEHNTYSWKLNKTEPEDANDHTINASQYSWLPFKEDIGKEEKTWE